jgi:hypothetical protein
MNGFDLELCRAVYNFSIEYFSVFVRSKVPDLHKMMNKVTHNYTFDRLANIMPWQTGIPLLNLIHSKLSNIINILDTTIIVLNSWVQFNGIFRKYLMFITVISAIT